MAPEQLLEKQHQEFIKFRTSLSKETDRGCALFASSYLEKVLSDLICCALAHDWDIEKIYLQKQLRLQYSALE